MAVVTEQDHILEELALLRLSEEDWVRWVDMRKDMMHGLDAIQPVLRDVVPRNVATLDHFLVLDVWTEGSTCLAGLWGRLQNVRDGLRRAMEHYTELERLMEMIFGQKRILEPMEGLEQT